MEKESTIIEEEVRGQGVFVSSFRHSLDPKKRLTIPSEWRVQVGASTSLYVLPDVQEKCLCVFPSAEMMRRLEKMGRHSVTDKKARQFARVLASQSDLVSWDTQGRIRIKDELLDFAGLSDQVMLVGAFQGFELWNPGDYDRVNKLEQVDIEEATRYVGF